MSFPDLGVGTRSPFPKIPFLRHWTLATTWCSFSSAQNENRTRRGAVSGESLICRKLGRWVGKVF